MSGCPRLHTHVRRRLDRAGGRVIRLRAVLSHGSVSHSIVGSSVDGVTTLKRSVNNVFPSSRVIGNSVDKCIFRRFRVTYCASLLTTTGGTNSATSVPAVRTVLGRRGRVTS